MVGDGKNRKSMAYVENIAAFLEHALTNGPGIHTYNYIDKPDFDMNTLVTKVKSALGIDPKVGTRIPYLIGLIAGYSFDGIAKFTERNFLSAPFAFRNSARTQHTTHLSQQQDSHHRFS